MISGREQGGPAPQDALELVRTTSAEHHRDPAHYKTRFAAAYLLEKETGQAAAPLRPPPRWVTGRLFAGVPPMSSGKHDENGIVEA